MPIAVSGFEHLASEVLTAYEQAEEAILHKMANHLGKDTASAQWANRKYSESQAVTNELKSVIEDLKAGRDVMTSEFVNKAWSESSKAFVSEARQFTDMLGITELAPNSPKVLAILSELDEALSAEDRLILRQANDAYADIIGRVSARVATGSITYREAVKEELDDFAKRGISGFTDKAGRRWEMSTYAEMATLTAIERATIEGYTDTMQEYGYDLAIISSHAGACPMCEAWEDVVVSVSGENHDYPSLDEAEGAGCFHPRCLHHLSTYYEGITRKGRNSPRPVREPSIAYSSRQTQRGLERKVRQWKRVMAASTDPVSERKAYAKVKNYQGKIRALIDKYGETDDMLMRKYWREGGRVKLSAAAKKIKPTQLNAR